MRIAPLAAVWLAVLFAGISPAQDTSPVSMFLSFVRRQAAELRAQDKPPAALADWEKERAALRDRIQQAWGEFPASPCPLQPRLVGTLSREGYRVEKIVFQTRPGIWMTANAYVPDRPGKLPAVLCVHGHWAGAKQDPVVQSRCLGLTKLGFFVLVVDAFGAGERGLSKALGEYHGEMVAATLLPVGLPLCGLQVYENGRAIDYLLTRPEVDGRRLGVTGASGGGNQTMYAGAWDDRLAAAVPVCSVGNYQAYLGAACCMCEVVPGALQFTEESGLLALTAPRALMIVNATKDGRQFSVAEARKSIAAARPVFVLYGHPENLRHTIFESPHDYNGAMREAMYGWMSRFLAGAGDGAPIREPSIKTEDREALRCFPGQSRPDDFRTIPQFAAEEARKLLARKTLPNDAEQWRAVRAAMLQGLNKALHGGNPPAPAARALLSVTKDGTCRTITFQPEPGLTLVARLEPAAPSANKLAVVLDLEGSEQACRNPLTAALRGDGWRVLTADLRATGKLADPHDRIGRAPDHNTAEWSLWLGRPLVGQWTIDVRRLLDAVNECDGKLPDRILVAGIGPAGLVAVCSAALDRRITHVAAAGMLASFVTDEPYQGQRLGIMAPGILRQAGDVGHLAALVAPRKCVIAGGVTGGGKPVHAATLRAAFAFAQSAYRIEGAPAALGILPAADAQEIVKALR